MMSKQPRRSAAQWQHLVEEQQESGLTQKAFSEQHGIAPSAFGYWKRKLSAASTTDQDNESSWLDLSALAITNEQSGTWKIELDLGNGVVLRLSQQG